MARIRRLDRQTAQARAAELARRPGKERGEAPRYPDHDQPRTDAPTRDLFSSDETPSASGRAGLGQAMTQRHPAPRDSTRPPPRSPTRAAGPPPAPSLQGSAPASAGGAGRPSTRLHGCTAAGPPWQRRPRTVTGRRSATLRACRGSPGSAPEGSSAAHRSLLNKTACSLRLFAAFPERKRAHSQRRQAGPVGGLSAYVPHRRPLHGRTAHTCPRLSSRSSSGSSCTPRVLSTMETSWYCPMANTRSSNCGVV